MSIVFESRHPTNKSSFWLRVYGNEDGSMVISVSREIAYFFGVFFSWPLHTCFKILCDSLNNMLQLLIGNEESPLFSSNSQVSVSAIPVSNGNRTGIAWKLAKWVAGENGLEFIDSQLQTTKPKMKNLCLEDRVTTWNDIYTDAPPRVQREQIENKIIVIIDDLYQSGISMLAYAKFLRQYKPSAIYGLACVKTRGDSDNT